MTAVPNISERIWDMKYRLKSAAGKPVDKSLEDTWRRVAKSLAAPEAEPDLWEEHFYRALEDFHFIPAGRILAGAGARRQVTLFNCFVMGTVPDDMAGIFQQLKEAALTLQQGGGIGYDFSTLRPKGAPVRGLHGGVGRHVPHHPERRRAPGRHDGHPALRPSGHRGFRHGQADPRPPHHV
jgi:ribonucleoside-diphosphate reductase alpha chain